MPSPIPANVNNKKLYQNIKDEIHAQDDAAGRQWGKHSSTRLVTTYKKRGGTYSGRKPAYKSPTKRRRSPRGEGGLRQWEDEKWQDQYGRPCGSGKKGEVVKCRPTVRVNKSTPVTWNEIKASGKKSQVVNAKKKVGMGNRAPTIKRSPTKKSPTKRSPRGSLSSAPEDFKTKKPLYKPYKSTRSKKKGMVYVKNPEKKDGKELIHFGDANMSDYTKHHDKDRRKRYLTRSAGITDDQGHLTKDDKNSANYWSRKINW